MDLERPPDGVSQRPKFALQAPVRIKTRTTEIKSGFEYTTTLFNLGIDPARWEDFSRDVRRASKLNDRDNAAIIGTVTGFSLIGLAGVGVVYGELVREKREVKRVMANRIEGEILAQIVESWNSGYFCEFGVKVWVEVPEAALREQARKRGVEVPEYVRPKRTFKEKTPLVAFDKRMWKRREEEKKYMVVLSPVDVEDEERPDEVTSDVVDDPFADPPIRHKSHIDLV